jgi:hypothetical protein
MPGRAAREQRAERVVCETDRHLIVGDVALPPDGYQSRFSDAINRPEIGFLPLADVEIRPLDGGAVEQRDFVVVGKAHVRLAYPASPESA